jgi:hypothetical protein
VTGASGPWNVTPPDEPRAWRPPHPSQSYTLLLVFTLKPPSTLNPPILSSRPQVFHYDGGRSLIAMEFVAPPAVILRGGIIAGKTYPKLAGHVARFLAETLFNTSLFALDTRAFRWAAGVGLGAIGAAPPQSAGSPQTRLCSSQAAPHSIPPPKPPPPPPRPPSTPGRRSSSSPTPICAR